jgi:hypothetical protein
MRKLPKYVLAPLLLVRMLSYRCYDTDRSMVQQQHVRYYSEWTSAREEEHSQSQGCTYRNRNRHGRNRVERGMTITFLRDVFIREVVPCTLAVVPSRTEAGPSNPAVVLLPCSRQFPKNEAGQPGV